MLLSACWPPGALSLPRSNLNTTAEQFVLNFSPLFKILQKACLIQKKPKGSLASPDCPPQALKQRSRTMAHGPQTYCTAHTTRNKFYIFKQWKKLKKQNIFWCEGILYSSDPTFMEEALVEQSQVGLPVLRGHLHTPPLARPAEFAIYCGSLHSWETPAWAHTLSIENWLPCTLGIVLVMNPREDSEMATQIYLQVVR